ncbi:oligoendopeptidase F [Ameyamaea chiangmaiensis NBRC 103196]|uniref:M3 family oligoendopeptidase n=1 Tax=Ameyamaea chiangmaiensis TaxID=442969 RepID=A0A850PF84_9PROT|nr:M3 family oligoendopeptidase [Ameyamaea chiangmaiensis]MBS4074277.1 M3 family oligoendopeptidase [Ameyamaea chiangmaiensis]NVN40572.1 M3 family oligoendopeptidase [Ameyamaea chiangmaiensis]GBQ71474.1 oligoendopeptidase F [Ameyamaea chiangmaiensis NBRC 103196]
MIQNFAALDFPRPTRESLAEAYATIHASLDEGRRRQAIAAFDAVRRHYESWASLVHLRFSQDTTSDAAKAERDYADALTPVATGHEVDVKRRLLDPSLRDELERDVGAHTAALWACDITTFDPRIAPMLEEEARLSGEYTALLASAKIDIDGRTVNLSGLAPYAESLDRNKRHAAEQARWAFFETHGETLDALYDRLVKLRHEMARTLGFDTYTQLGYRRMRRVDYGPEEVSRFRDKIVTYVVPLVKVLLEHRRLAMGWDRLRSWDEGLIDPKGNPRPAGDHDLLVARAQQMFDAMGGDLGPFFAQMNAGGYLDLRNRPGKAGGGFCTSFPDVGMPFIFANFNGTHNDISVFTHEMGHAYQNYKSREQPGIDVLWPTMEAAEINSMGLEFLTWPHMELMVEEGAADRFRRMHLIDSLSFLPYGACVDHFQHEVYAQPDMTPAERHETWRALEKIYLPWRDYGDLAWPAKGGRWQAQMHIYRSPFYYIDYTLALCCAMQFWLQSRMDPQGTLDAYVELCAKGGSKPFTALVDEAGLVSPFSAGALAEVVREAERLLLD